jgi:GR25 family glycosyltransferase involved in LPS biosynthesis
MDKKSICLNMIVKNESKIIKELISNIARYIDYWVISDTGSTDNTIEVITNSFAELNIPGKIFQDNWVNFAHNRTKAIEHAYMICDYIWVMDADDLVIGNMVFPNRMDKDMYNLVFGTGITYIRPLLFKSSLKWKYRSVVHEFAECVSVKNPSSDIIQGDYYIDSRRLGSRSSDPEKYLKDAQVLIKALEENNEPDLRTRYLFYIGQSFFDYKDYTNALKWYSKQITQNGWIEETYYASLKMCFCMQKLNFSEDEIVAQFLKTYAIIQERPEALYYLSTYLKDNALKLTDTDTKQIKLKKCLYYLIQLNGQKHKLDEKNITRLFINTEIFEWLGLYEMALVYYNLDNKLKTLQICNELLDRDSIRLDNFKYEKIISLKNFANAYEVNLLTKYPKELVEKITTKYKNNEINQKKNIILTMTTCKRLDLFIKTINSFLNCCKDIDMIDKWIIIDDNSSLEDRDVMRYEYPFVEWVFKTKEQKGHANSMNMLLELTQDYKYVLHLEDDWLFIEHTYYIKPSIDILESTQFTFINSKGMNVIKDKEIGQVLFNCNYSEDIDKIIYGGFLTETKSNLKTKFILHEHYEDTTSDYPLKNKPNCAYWPHYSFRPSIIKRAIFAKLGPYNLNGFFEREYANRYYANGYVSCFFDKTTSIHIGKKTNEKNGTNAYELNGENQFTTKPDPNGNYSNNKFIFIPNLDSYGNDICHLTNKTIDELCNYSLDISNCVCFNTYGYLKSKLENDLIPLYNSTHNPDGLFININKLHQEIICLNLERRTDRKKQMTEQFEQLNIKYKFHNAVDGLSLKPTDEIIKLFKNNDFYSKKGVIGCALSHKQLWENLIGEKYKNYYVIFEDDVQIHNKFSEYLSDIQEIILQIPDWDIIFLGYSLYDNDYKLYNVDDFNSDIPIEITECDINKYIGGIFGYLISKSGANKLLKYIETNGIKHGIDYLIKIVDDLNIYQLSKFIVKTDWVQNLNSTVDSDIQKNYDFIDIYSDNDFEYIRGVDSPGNDLLRLNKLSIDELKKYALENPDCVCFNSLGFLKTKFEKTVKTPYYNKFDDGLYVKKQKQKIIRIKMLCNWTNSKNLCDEWNWMSKGNYRWNNLEITWEDSNIDLYVIINKPNPHENEFYIGSKTIVYQMEPRCDNQKQMEWGVKTWGLWAEPNPKDFLQVRTSKKYLNNCLWQFALTYDYFKTHPIIKDESKLNIISSICSSKYFDPGHIKRIDFLKYIENRNDPDVLLDIYNRDNFHEFKSWKGKLDPYVDKHLGIIPYRYYFMCENNPENNFMTEKIWEPIISETLVFYWGCPNISTYINPLAYVQLDMDDFEKSFQIIKDAIKNNLWEQRINIIREEKQKILDYYNFFPTLERIIYNDFNLKNNFTQDDLMYNKIIFDLELDNGVKNVCFIHSCNLIERISNPKLDYLIDNIIKTNCIDTLDYIIINNIGYNISIDEYIFNKYPNLANKIKIINFSTIPTLYEIPTIKLLWYFSNKYSNVNILYLHTKGVSYEFINNNEHLLECNNDWINLMLYFLVNNYESSIKLLDTYDSVGINYCEFDFESNRKPHWSGNFWWSKSDYISSLSINSLNNKHDAEWFILSNTNVNYFELFNSNINHYTHTYGVKNYLLDSNLLNKNYRNLLYFLSNKYYSSAWKGHFEFAIQLVQMIKPKIIVELGVDFAHSTFCLSSELGSDSIIYGIDSFEGDENAGKRNTHNIVLDTYKFLLDKKFLPHDNVKFIKGYFDNISKNFTDKIDLLHIDGLHTYEAVKNDFETWFPKTSENAIVMFHDTISFPNDVGKLFNELPYYKTNFTHSAGLGILSKNKQLIDLINERFNK